MALRILLCIFAVSILNNVAASGQPAETADIKVPDGFVIERVAAAPLVTYPMMAGFDDRGRLFVAENAGVNLKFEELVKDPPSRVVMLEDTDGDHVFDKRTVFADKLTFPSGALWHDGALYVASPPGIWRFRDTDNDGVADQRDQIVTGFGSSGNAADLHGPFLGPEGWLYFCDGRNGHDLTLGDGTKWKGKAACIYRCRPDGTGLEIVFGGGFDNPVEIAFTPEGEPLVNVNIVQSHPLRVDAILYGIEGGNYPHADAWTELKRTGEFQPSVGDLGWVATSGFMRYRGNALGEKYIGRYFSTEFNTRRVRSHVVEREGAGFHITHEEFLSSDKSDFHPTDALEDADGSLIVIDTGGWFRIGCPASQIAKPEVTGAIYRVRRVNAAKPNHRLASEVDHRLADIRLAALSRDPKSENVFLAGLTDANLAIRRESATGLGRLRSRRAVAPLIDAASLAGGDKFLEHAITFALISIADRATTLAGLRHESPASRRAALVALDQMEAGNLTADLVLPHLASQNPPLRDIAFAIVAAHPAWAEQVVPTLRTALQKAEIKKADAESIRAVLSAFIQTEPAQSLVTEILSGESTPSAHRRIVLESIGGSGISPLPAVWTNPLRRLLDCEENVARQCVDIISNTGSGEFDADLSRIYGDTARTPSLRVAALAATLARTTSLDATAFQLLKTELATDREPLARLAAAQAIAEAPLNDGQLREVAKLLPAAGALELPALISAFGRSSNPEIGSALVESLNSTKSLAGVSPSILSEALAKYPRPIQAAAGPLIAKINPDGPAQKARLAELEPLLTGGSPNRGQSVFFGKTTACASCHAVKGTGAHVGPDLSKIASIRSARDLLESLVFPSASFARGYEPFIVQTKSNQVHSGVMAGETADSIVLRTPAEVRIPRSTVKIIRQDRVSIMPQGLEAQLSKEELADLLAFLQSLK
jgi:putative membrane-bound dehydrogenase-like protein